MASTLVILAAVMAVVSSVPYMGLRAGQPWFAPAAAREMWLMNPAGDSMLHPENPSLHFAAAPAAMSPSHIQAVHAFDDETVAAFSPAPAPFPQSSSVRIINAADDISTASSGADVAFLPGPPNPPTVFTLAPRAATFSNAPSSDSFAPASPVYFVNPHSAGAHLIRTASPAHTATFTPTPAVNTIMSLEAPSNLARSPSAFVISPSPISSALSVAPSMMSAPYSRSAVFDSSANPPTENAVILADASCARGALCVAHPAARYPLRGVSAANVLGGLSPSTVVTVATPATLMAAPSSRAVGYEEFSSSPADTPMTRAGISCPINFICSEHPAMHASLRSAAPANHINAQYPGAIVWDATPSASAPFPHAGAAKLIPVSAHAVSAFAPISVAPSPASSPLAFSSALVQPLA